MRKINLKYLLFFISFWNITICLSQDIDEYQMKAGYIGKFAQYINWSDHANYYSDDFFIISIIGESPIEQALIEFYSNQKINGKSVKIISSTDLIQISEINILFIAQGNRSNLEDIIRQTENKPILTISDASGFSKKGVLVNFYTERNTIRFEINKSRVEMSDLEMNSLLYRVAKIAENE